MKQVQFLIIVLGALILTIACGGRVASNENRSDVKDAQTAVEVKNLPPQRIASLSPSVSEILYGIGAFSRVVAVSDYDTYPPEAKTLPHIGGWQNINLEQIAALKLDLIAMTDAEAPLVKDKLDALGVKTLVVPSHTVEDALTAIEQIGRAVGNELVSQETVVKALFDADFFRRKVAGFVNTYSDELLNTAYPSLIEALPSSIRATMLETVAALQQQMAKYISEMLQSDETRAAVREFVNARTDELLARRLTDAVNDELFDKIVRFVGDRFVHLVGAPDFEKKFRAFLSAQIDELIHSQATLAELFTSDAVVLIKQRLDSQIAPVVGELTNIATSQKTRTQIGALIKREVEDYYRQLSFLKKIFISRERINNEVDELVNTTLPRRVAEYLNGEAFAEDAKTFLDTTIDNLLQRPVRDIIGQIAPDRFEIIKDQITARLIALVRSPELITTISLYTRDALARLHPHTTRALLQNIQPAAVPRLKNLLTNGLLTLLTREDTARTLNKIIGVQIEKLLLKPIGRPTDYIKPETINSARDTLTERITTSARERLPATIAEFDIGTIVRQKVEEYPVEKLEALVLSVSKEHLRTIELFGLYMGFAIGVFQVLALWLGPRILDLLFGAR
ncbi:MAG: hypothetical protein NVSMB56_07890 [Pyrinomonadaceae bacterium]